MKMGMPLCVCVLVCVVCIHLQFFMPLAAGLSDIKPEPLGSYKEGTFVGEPGGELVFGFLP